MSGGGERVRGSRAQQEAGQAECRGEHAAAAGIQSTVPAALQARHQEHAILRGQSPTTLPACPVCRNLFDCFSAYVKKKYNKIDVIYMCKAADGCVEFNSAVLVVPVVIAPCLSSLSEAVGRAVSAHV